MARKKELTHAAIIRLWPTVIDFAADIGVKVETARKMVSRDSISDDYWADVEAAAKARRIKTPEGESVTVALLARCKAAKRGRRAKRPPR